MWKHNHKLGLTFLLERDNIGVDTVRVLHRAVVVPKVLFADWPDNQLALETISNLMMEHGCAVMTLRVPDKQHLNAMQVSSFV